MSKSVSPQTPSSNAYHLRSPLDLYYISFPRDKLLPKAIVTTTYVLEVLQVCMSVSDGFRNFGTGWGDMVDLNTVGLLWFSVPVLGSVSTFKTQFFTERRADYCQSASRRSCFMPGGYGSSVASPLSSGRYWWYVPSSPCRIRTQMITGSGGTTWFRHICWS